MTLSNQFWLGVDPAREDDDRTIIVVTGVTTAEIVLALENVFVSGTSALPNAILASEATAHAISRLNQSRSVFSFLPPSSREERQQAWRDIKKRAIDDSKRAQQRMKLSRGRR